MARQDQSITGSETRKIKTLPVIKEKAIISKLDTVTGRVDVAITTNTERHAETIDLVSTSVRETRVPIDKIVEERSAVRQEGNTTIIPVFQEEVVLVKRIRLVEEIHLTREERTETVTEEIDLRVDEVTVVRS